MTRGCAQWCVGSLGGEGRGPTHRLPGWEAETGWPKDKVCWGESGYSERPRDGEPPGQSLAPESH